MNFDKVAGERAWSRVRLHQKKDKCLICYPIYHIFSFSPYNFESIWSHLSLTCTYIPFQYEEVLILFTEIFKWDISYMLSWRFYYVQQMLVVSINSMDISFFMRQFLSKIYILMLCVFTLIEGLFPTFVSLIWIAIYFSNVLLVSNQ
jgi:hypothetical protein